MLNTQEYGLHLPPELTQAGGKSTGQWVPLPRNKFIVAIAKRKTGHPVGGSLLEVLSWFWIATQFNNEWWLNYTQLFGQPFRIGTYDPQRAGLKDVLSDMLENMGSAAWAALPEGTKVEIIAAASGAGENAQKVFAQNSDTVCDNLILGQQLTSQTGSSGGGSHALGKVQEGVRADVLRSAAEFAARGLNSQFIRPQIEMAFGETSELPWFMPNRDEAKDAVAMAQRDQILLSAGIEMPLTWIYERHDIPLPQPGEETIGGVAAAAQANGAEPGGSSGGGGQQQDDSVPAETDSDVSAKSFRTATAASAAKTGQAKLVDNVLEDLTGVEAKWLGGVKPYFVHLVQQAKDTAHITDDMFVAALRGASKQMPELFGKLGTHHVKTALEHAMASAAVNGVAAGIMARGTGRPASARASARLRTGQAGPSGARP